MSKRTVVHLLRPHLAVGGTPTLAVSSAALPPSIRLHTVRPAKTPLRDHVMPLSYSARMYSSRQINCASEANRFLDHPHLLGASIRRTGTRVEIEQRRLRTALTRIETFAAYAFSSDKSPAQAEPWPPKKICRGPLVSLRCSDTWATAQRMHSVASLWRFPLVPGRPLGSCAIPGCAGRVSEGSPNNSLCHNQIGPAAPCSVHL